MVARIVQQARVENAVHGDAKHVHWRQQGEWMMVSTSMVIVLLFWVAMIIIKRSKTNDAVEDDGLAMSK